MVIGKGIEGDYYKTLCDPWECPPVKLGYMTYTPTILATAYVRASLQVNADGSFGLQMTPCIGNVSSVSFLQTNIASAVTSSWTNFAATNSSAIAAQMVGARVVSGGLRAFALFPETSAPGVLFAGSICSSSAATSSLTATTYSQLPSAELGIGSRGARTVITPSDPSALEFFPQVLTAFSASSLLPYTLPFIVGLGFPAATTIWFEAVLNVEGLPLQTTTTNIGVDADQAPTLMDQIPSFETVSKRARQLLGNSAVMDATEGLASSLNPTLGRVVGLTRSAFGHGRHLARTMLASGESVSSQSKQNTILIEEMKEESDQSSRRL